jgi:hypothetical protein
MQGTPQAQPHRSGAQRPIARPQANPIIWGAHHDRIATFQSLLIIGKIYADRGIIERSDS